MPAYHPQLTSCPRCGSEIDPKHIWVDVNPPNKIYCGDKKGRCEFSEGASAQEAHPGLPAVVVDEELYHRPPSMMIATVDKFAMAWRGETRTLFGIADTGVLDMDWSGLMRIAKDATPQIQRNARESRAQACCTNPPP